MTGSSKLLGAPVGGRGNRQMKLSFSTEKDSERSKCVGGG